MIDRDQDVHTQTQEREFPEIDRLPRHHPSIFSHRAEVVTPETDVTVFPRKGRPFRATILGRIETPKQPNNPQIEVRSHKSGDTLRLGAGTCVERVRRMVLTGVGKVRYE